MDGDSESDGGSENNPASSRFRRWVLAHAPWLWTPNGHDWFPTSWVSLGALVAVMLVVGIVISVLS